MSNTLNQGEHQRAMVDVTLKDVTSKVMGDGTVILHFEAKLPDYRFLRQYLTDQVGLKDSQIDEVCDSFTRMCMINGLEAHMLK